MKDAARDAWNRDLRIFTGDPKRGVVLDACHLGYMVLTCFMWNCSVTEHQVEA